VRLYFAEIRISDPKAARGQGMKDGLGRDRGATTTRDITRERDSGTNTNASPPQTTWIRSIEARRRNYGFLILLPSVL
jgi:hypothetical protein